MFQELSVSGKLREEIVPGLPDLFNILNKRGRVWYAKSHEIRHPVELYIPVVDTVLCGDVTYMILCTRLPLFSLVH